MPAKRKEIATAANAVHLNFLFPQSILTFENMFVPPLPLKLGASYERATSTAFFKDKGRRLKEDETRIRIF
jgi:hypothetical protein